MIDLLGMLIALVLGVAGAFALGKRKGRSQGRADERDAARAGADKRKEERNEIDADVVSGGSAADRLRKDFSRD